MGFFISVSRWLVGSPKVPDKGLTSGEGEDRSGAAAPPGGMQLIQYFVFGIYKL